MAKFEKAKKVKKEKRAWGRVRIGQYQPYFWAVPALPFYHFWNKFNQWKYDRLVWDEERATKVLDKILPTKLDYDEENKAFYYCMEWSWWGLWEYAPLKDREWAKKFCSKLHPFILEGYENADYIKTVEKDWNDTWVKFSEK